MRTRNFRAWKETVERGAATKSQKGEKSQRGEESGRMLSVESKWTVFERRLHAVSVMNEHPETFWKKRKDSVPKFSSGEKRTNPSCCWHPPVCLKCKSESECKFDEKCRFRHAEVDGRPSKKSKKSGVKDELF